MGLSSNSLIHLTKTKESLKGILTENFKIKYCLETINTTDKTFKAAIPMVSFCDIPLSEIKNHIQNYGSYGIGLQKEWGINNKLNPVLYIEKESILGVNYFKVYADTFSGKQIGALTDTEAALLDICRYMKNYQDNLIRNGNTIENYRFSDEREWRYVPPREVAKMLYLSKYYDTNDKKRNANLQIKDLRLKFEPNDIKYIIVNDEKDISEIISLLRNTKSKYVYEDVERLMTRIITTEQILSDF